MNRSNQKQRQKERQQIIDNASQQKSFIVEKDEATITKLLSSQIYIKEDIEKCAKSLLEENGHSSEKQLKIVEKIDEFDKVFENVDCQLQKPIFVIFGKPKLRWVLLCLTKTSENQKVALFKDPSGDSIGFRFKKKLNDLFSELTFLEQTQKDQERDDESSYGPLTLRNLKILLEFLKNSPDFEKFSTITFARPTNLRKEKVSQLVSLAESLAENEEFKKELKDFVDKLPVDMANGLLEYKRIMEEELEKDEEDANLKRIEEARKKYMDASKIKKIQEDYRISSENVEEHSFIKQKFPEEMKQLGDIFLLLDTIKVDKELYLTLQSLGEVLDIDYKKLEVLYKFKEKPDEQETDLLPENIDKIAKSLPSFNESLSNECTPLDQLLEEIVLGMDQEDNVSALKSSEEVKQLKQKYEKVKEHCEEYKNFNILKINSWAKETKKKLGNTEDDICKAIAIIDRAFNLLSGGFHLRDTQILAILIFFHDQQNQGRLCQIQTGEGKTNIVSFLATIRALQGLKVDVITSNSLLASAGVDETKTFYAIFDLTVATNNIGDSKEGYKADILYGTISNFQFDFLKDTFEGFNIRCNREFGQVILDEVDSMLVDNGGHIAKLASPYPGMECLKYIYIKIWVELHKAEESLAKDIQEEVNNIIKNVDNKEDAKLKYEEFIQEKIKDERKIIKEKIKASNPTNIPLIPQHLKSYVEKKLDVWIKNALHAKYNCHEHEQYRLITDDNKEEVIAPVDYLNTGVTMKNTIWSNGLHQFVQLKHNLHLTFESLTSSFISNIGYIKNYQDKQIFGLTGTLGSRAEQELLSHIYNINYAKLPTYKQKKFQELPGVVAEDESWATQVTVEILSKIDEERAVLVICETEQDLLTIQKNLEVFKDNFRVRLYSNEEHADETEKKVQIGDIILATNIAGRGTNFKTEKNLEEKGGLHVCVTFLPCNLRVEGQAFGRTSRQGNNGTAQLIIRKSEVDELEIDEVEPDFSQIKQKRNLVEKQRLKEINDILVKELNFKDQLFAKFAQFHRELKQTKMTESFRYVIQDLKEFWAFWLEKKDFKIDFIKVTTPEKQFDEFCKEAEPNIGGKICHNPYYCITLAEHYIDKDDTKKARNALQEAIKISDDTKHNLLSGAYLKLFELSIMNGHQLFTKFKKALSKIFFASVDGDPNYKIQARAYLELAQTSLKKEIDFLEQQIDPDSDIKKILYYNENNVFLKHVKSRLICLQFQENHVKSLLETLKSFDGVDIGSSAPTTIENFTKLDAQVGKIVTDSELIELQSVGISTIYALKKIPDVPATVIKSAQAQIFSGIGLVTVGLCFPPIFPVMSSLGGTLISEGIMDLVMELLFTSESFDSKDYTKGKFISYGVSLLTFGLSALTQSVTILSKAVSYCRRLSTFLRKSKYLKSICKALANTIDKLGDVLDGMLLVAKFNKLSKASQLDELLKLQKTDLSKFQKLGGVDKLDDLQKITNLGKVSRADLIVDFAKNLVVDTSKEIAKSIINKCVLEPLSDLALKKIFELLKQHLKKHLTEAIKNNKNLMVKLQTSSSEEIDKAVEAFLEQQDAKNTAKDISFDILDEFDNTVFTIFSSTYKLAESTAKLLTFSKKCSSYLENVLKGGDNSNDVEKIIQENIYDKVEDSIFSLCSDIFDSVKEYGKLGFEKIKEKVLAGIATTIAKEKDESKDSIKKINDDNETTTKNSYKVLGLEEGALLEEVRRQYRRKALQLHPDKNLNNPRAKENFQALQNAYEDICKNSTA